MENSGLSRKLLVPVLLFPLALAALTRLGLRSAVRMDATVLEPRLLAAGQEPAQNDHRPANGSSLGVEQLAYTANDPTTLAKCTVIQRHHVALFTAYLEKLRSTSDGDGSLLDHMIIRYGAGLSNSGPHTHGPLPTLVLGGEPERSRATVTLCIRMTGR